MRLIRLCSIILVLLMVGCTQGYAGFQNDCPNCLLISNSRVECPTDSTGLMIWQFDVTNQSDFDAAHLFFLRMPSGTGLSQQHVQFDTPLRPGETRRITLTINGAYPGQTLCYEMVLYNATLDRCCRAEHCVTASMCCADLRNLEVYCDPHTGEFNVSFVLFNQFPAIIQYLVFLSETPGVSIQPQIQTLFPALGYLNSRRVSFRVQGASPGQTIRFRMGMLDYFGRFCCSIVQEVTMPPCCFEITQSNVECNDQGITYHFTLRNWYPASIRYIAVVPTTSGITVSPAMITVNPSLPFGATGSFQVRVNGIQCPQEVCLRLILFDQLFRECCSDEVCFQARSAPYSRTYTSDADFDQGILDNVNHNFPNNDQLQLNPPVLDPNQFDYPFAWVANSGDGTLSKIDAVSGREVARYLTGGLGATDTPSRTSVDGRGNCWVANRAFNVQGSVTQVILEEEWTPFGPYDRNMDGVLQTSRDLNGDGCLDDPGEVLPWGQDELVARHYLIGATNGVPRAITIDQRGYLWVGLFNEGRVVQVDPNLGPEGFRPGQNGRPILLESVATPSTPYGLAVASNGFLYMATLARPLIEICPGDPIVIGDAAVTQNVDTNVTTYGIAVDRNCIVWCNDFNTGRLVRWNPTQGQAGVSISSASPGGNWRGVSVDFDGNIWQVRTTAGSPGQVTKWAPTNPPTLLDTYDVPGISRGSGIGVTAGGHIAVVGGPAGGSGFSVITTGGVHLRSTCTGREPYTYSDFTGSQLFQLRNRGSWTVIEDSGCTDTPWGKIRWNARVPQTTNLRVFVRAGNTNPPSSSYIEVGNGDTVCIRGRYLQTQVVFERQADTDPVNCERRCPDPTATTDTPALYDLTVQSLCDCDRRPASISGKVYSDTNRDGQLQDNERSLDSWQVRLRNPQGHTLSSLTDHEGRFVFDNLVPGEYVLEQHMPQGWMPINPPGGSRQIQLTPSHQMNVHLANWLVGDVSGDNCVDDNDLLQILYAFGNTEGIEDLDRNGIVDDSDILMVLMNFGIGC